MLHANVAPFSLQFLFLKRVIKQFEKVYLFRLMFNYTKRKEKVSEKHPKQYADIAVNTWVLYRRNREVA